MWNKPSTWPGPWEPVSSYRGGECHTTRDPAIFAAQLPVLQTGAPVAARAATAISGAGQADDPQGRRGGRTCFSPAAMATILCHVILLAASKCTKGRPPKKKLRQCCDPPCRSGVEGGADAPLFPCPVPLKKRASLWRIFLKNHGADDIIARLFGSSEVKIWGYERCLKRVLTMTCI